MNWIKTEHTKRSLLGKFLTQGASRYVFRGAIVWTVINNKIVAFKIRKGETTWEYCRVEEDEFDDTFLSCPISYFALAPTIKYEWRQLIISKKNNLEVTKASLDKDFLDAQKEGNQIEVLTNSTTVPKVILESIVPLKGRWKGVLYDIPIKRVISWKKLTTQN